MFDWTYFFRREYKDQLCQVLDKMGVFSAKVHLLHITFFSFALDSKTNDQNDFIYLVFVINDPAITAGLLGFLWSVCIVRHVGKFWIIIQLSLWFTCVCKLVNEPTQEILFVVHSQFRLTGKNLKCLTLNLRFIGQYLWRVPKCYRKPESCHIKYKVFLIVYPIKWKKGIWNTAMMISYPRY